LIFQKDDVFTSCVADVAIEPMVTVESSFLNSKRAFESDAAQTLQIPCSLLYEWGKKINLTEAVNSCLKSLQLNKNAELEERLQAKSQKLSHTIKKLGYGRTRINYLKTKHVLFDIKECDMICVLNFVHRLRCFNLTSTSC
jgi:hypothetical protein